MAFRFWLEPTGSLTRLRWERPPGEGRGLPPGRNPSKRVCSGAQKHGRRPPMNNSDVAATATQASAPNTGSATSKEVDPRATLEAMRAAARKAGVPSYDERIAALDTLERAVLKRKDAIAKAIASDFGTRSKHETLVADVFVVLGSIKHTRSHLRDWMEPEDRETSFVFMPATCKVVYQPIGVVGIISPWNYPVQLALAPLVAALAAGNRAMIKPSELVPETAALLRDLISETFPADQV